ncbi:MAG: hypothetical protein ACKOJF_32595, partial [Planctomycetaceae bacterium]
MLSRRLLMQGGLAAMALGTTGGMPSTGVANAAAPAGPPNLEKHPYIDAHSHVWSPDTDKWPLEKGQTKADLKPASFTPAELLAQAHPVGVGRVV